jgi:hypothetical protein
MIEIIQQVWVVLRYAILVVQILVVQILVVCLLMLVSHAIAHVNNSSRRTPAAKAQSRGSSFGL